MSKKRKPSDSEVGYCRPPKHTQFKPGHSGNPKGRPKGARDLRSDLTDELAERIDIHEGGRRVRLTKQRVMLKTLIARAAKGDVRALNAIFSLILRLPAPDKTAAPEELTLDEQELRDILLALATSAAPKKS